VSFSVESQHFVFVENVVHEFKKRFEMILTAGTVVKILSKVAQKDPLHHVCKDRLFKKNRIF